MKKRIVNPILPPEWCIPDGEAHVFNNKLYLYGSCDQSDNHFCSDEYYVASTENLSEWEIKGPTFKTSDVNWAKQSKIHSSVSHVTCFDDLPDHIRHHIPESMKDLPIEIIIEAIESESKKNLPDEILLYAPDAIQRNDTTYMFFCLSDDSIGVASSLTPDGKFEDVKQVRFSKSKKPLEGIDPAVFIDDDGIGYLYWGQFSMKVGQLSDDMSEIVEETYIDGLLTELVDGFHEGSSIRKRDGIYYLIFADSKRGKPTCLSYATSKSPYGPFMYQGVIIDNSKTDPKSWNIHGSIEEFNDDWYVFYHKSCGNSEYNRRACIEKINFDEFGRISEVKPTSIGVGEPFNLGEVIPAYTSCEVSDGVYVSSAKYGNQLVVDSFGKASYRYIKTTVFANTLKINGSGDCQIEILNRNGQLFGKGRLIDKEIMIYLEPGLHEILFKFSDVSNAIIKDFYFY